MHHGGTAHACALSVSRKTPEEDTIHICGILHACILPLDPILCKMQLGLYKQIWRELLVTMADCMSTFYQGILPMTGHYPQCKRTISEETRRGRKGK